MEASSGISSAKNFPNSTLSRRISWFHACRLLLSLQLLRLRNQALGPRSPSRTGRSRLAASPWATLVRTAVALGIFAGLTAFGLAVGEFFAAGAGGKLSNLSAVPGVAAFITYCLVTIYGFGLGYTNRDFSSPANGWQALAGLPVPLATIGIAEFLKRSLFNKKAQSTVYPLLLGLASHGQWSWTAIGVSLAASQLLISLLASAQLFTEYAARILLSTRALATLQLAATLGSTGLVVSLLALFKWRLNASPMGPEVYPTIPVVSPGVRWMVLFREGSMVEAASQAGRCFAEFIVLFGVLTLATGAMSRRVLLGGQGPEGDGKHNRTRTASSLLHSQWPVAVNEIKWLGRNRKALYNVLAIPVMALTQLFILGDSPSLRGILNSPSGLSVLALLFGGTAGLVGAQVVKQEGQSLWIAFTLPISLARQQLQRAWVWVPLGVAVALGYALLGMRGQPASWVLLGSIGYCLVGVTLVTLLGLGIATAEQSTTSSSLSIETSSNGPLWWGMGALCYCAAGLATPIWIQLATLVFLAVSVVSVWETVEERLRAQQDPSNPTRATSLALVGLGLTLTMVLVQQVVASWTQANHVTSQWLARAIGYGLSLAAVLGASTGLWYICRRPRTRIAELTGLLQWPTSLVSLVRESLPWSVGASLLATLTACLALVAATLEQFPKGETSPPIQGPEDLALALLVMCIAAPVIEELLFRGLLLSGLRRTLSHKLGSYLCATLFAIYHPPLAWPMVFALALLTTRALDKTKSIYPPMIAHAAYNLTLIVISVTISFY